MSCAQRNGYATVFCVVSALFFSPDHERKWYRIILCFLPVLRQWKALIITAAVWVFPIFLERSTWRGSNNIDRQRRYKGSAAFHGGKMRFIAKRVTYVGTYFRTCLLSNSSSSSSEPLLLFLSCGIGEIPMHQNKMTRVLQERFHQQPPRAAFGKGTGRLPSSPEGIVSSLMCRTVFQAWSKWRRGSHSQVGTWGAAPPVQLQTDRGPKKGIIGDCTSFASETVTTYIRHVIPKSV